MSASAPAANRLDGALVRALRSEARFVSERQISGFVLDEADRDARFVVELFMDGYPTRIARANVCEDALRAEGIGDGCYGFVFAPESPRCGWRTAVNSWVLPCA